MDVALQIETAFVCGVSMELAAA
ncbi:hypothetical protein IL54_4583 [Sphingobium sp. ba1]|nr:hypothetical protein IL54_4583 [Sphingobium sp. ba1]